MVAVPVMAQQEFTDSSFLSFRLVQADVSYKRTYTIWEYIRGKTGKSDTAGSMYGSGDLFLSSRFVDWDYAGSMMEGADYETNYGDL